MDPNFQKRKKRYKIYDKLHRGFVNICIGVTMISGFALGYKVYEYFRYIRPLHLAQNKLAEEELLQEGRNIEESSNVELSA